MGITPSNYPGTEREILPYMVGNSLSLPYMVMGNPTGQGIQFQGMGILFNYLCDTCKLFLQSIRPSDLYEQLSFPNGASRMAIPDRSHDNVRLALICEKYNNKR